MSAPAPSLGREMLAFAARLYPICRSITGHGVRETLRLVQQRIPLRIHEVPTATRVFDWEVPLEWNIEDACVLDADGRRVVDFRAHNLHLVSYSEPVRLRLPLSELRRRLHVHASHADWIPYRTSYYQRSWGFCVARRELERWPDGLYEVRISSSLAKGSLSYGEFLLPGRSREEVLLFTHVCHPSLGNDNTSGIAVAAELAAWLALQPRRYTYRVVFAPGTIGSLCWLKRNEAGLARLRHGLVLGLLGDSSPLTYKQTRHGTADIDAIASHVIAELEPESRTMEFEPYGYDERQFCSPGFNLPVGRLTRAVNDGYAQYHSSADDLSLLRADALERSVEACRRIISIIEDNRRYVNLLQKGEPRLGKRGLYGATGGRSPAAHEHAMLWVLNQSDGTRSLLDIAQRSKLGFDAVRDAAVALERAKVVRDPQSRKTSPARKTSPTRKTSPARRAGRKRS